MSMRPVTVLATILTLALFCHAASASDVGQLVAKSVSVTTYRHYLDDLLYTHYGNDRDGESGADHDAARSNIFTTLQSLGLSVELQEFTSSGPHYNVVATQLGTLYPNSYYVIGAHYDSARTPGADDNASGVAGVMEVARVLLTFGADYTIKYIAFDMEEYGLYGSEAYVAAHPEDDIRGMISMDMIAYKGSGYGCQLESVYSTSYPFRLAVKSAVAEYGNGLTSVLAAGYGGSDHAPFESAGIPACLLIESSYSGNPCYHKACDSVDQPNYINYNFARDMTRSAAGFLADHALAHWPADCNNNSLPDLDEIQANPALDCNGNGRLDECEAHGTEDCNHNGVSDLCDVFNGTSTDCNLDGIPDECAWADCNGNGVLDQCDIASGFSQDCNKNGIPDSCDLANGTSLDCDGNGIPDECELNQGGTILEQMPSGASVAFAQDFSDVGIPEYNVKEWDDFTISAPLRFGRGQAFFSPEDWGGFGVIPFRVEVANAPGGAQAGATVVLSVMGTGEMGTGIVNWDFQGGLLPAGTWWLSVQATGGFGPYSMAYWKRTNVGTPNGSQHYFHNPGNAWGYGTTPVLGSMVYGSSADLAFILRDPFQGDCNKNGILDACDIASGTSQDNDGDGIPDECEDFSPPTPNPMTFETPGGIPTPISTTAIAMRATEGVDAYPVEYYFYAANTGSHTRSWGLDRTYTDVGLQPNKNYTYKVRARDKSVWQNETAYSAITYLATLIEAPTALSFGPITDNSIQVTAPGTFTRLTSYMSGMFFEVTKLDGTPVGGAQANTWGQVQTITVTGLTPGMTYRFRVKARNYYGVNETPWYPVFGYARQATTGATQCIPCGDLDQDGDVDYDDYVLMLNAVGRGSGEPQYNVCADSDNDGVVTLVDFQEWLQCYRQFIGNLSAPPPAPCRKGDMNGDGVINGLDIGGFARAKLGGTSEAGENLSCADYGGALEQDVAAFVAALLGS